MAALKFSTFLTKESFKFLEEEMFSNYYIIEKYIFNFSEKLKNETYNLIKSIKKTSEYLQNIDNYIYDKIIGIYDILFKLIENKYSSVSSEEYKNYKRKLENRFRKIDEEDEDEDEPEGPNQIDFESDFQKMKIDSDNLFSEIFSEVIIPEKSEIMGGLIVDLIEGEKDFKESIIDNLNLNVGITIVLKDFKLQSVNLGLNLCLTLIEFKYYIIVLFSFLENLQFRIVPSIDLNTCFQIGRETQLKEEGKTDDKFIIDLSLNLEISVSLEIGLYFPPIPTEGVEMSFTIGMKGILGAGRIGVKLEAYSKDVTGNETKNSIKIYSYYEYKAIQFYAFILFKIEIQMGFFSFSFKFYLFNKLFLDPCKKCSGKGKF